MEAQGCSMHVVMNAKTALEIGATIHSIIAFTSTSTDKAGCSVPAPGKGILTIGRQVNSKSDIPILVLPYRSCQLTFHSKQIKQWIENKLQLVKVEFNLQSKFSFKQS